MDDERWCEGEGTEFPCLNFPRQTLRIPGKPMVLLCNVCADDDKWYRLKKHMRPIHPTDRNSDAASHTSGP